jgi:cytochrome P450
MSKDYVGAFRRWQRRYGDVFTLRDVLGNTVVVLGDAELVRTLSSIADPEQFAGNTPESFDVLVGRNSLLMRGGVARQDERRRLQAPISRHVVEGWAPTIAEITRASFSTIAIDAPFVALAPARAATLELIVRLVFGAVDETAAELREVVRELMQLVRPGFVFTRLGQRSMFGRSAYARYLPVSRRLDALLHAHIQQLRARPDSLVADSVLASLLQQRDGEGRPLTDEVIADDLRTMLIGGHDSTANTLAWVLYFVHREPGLRERLREQLRAYASASEAGPACQLLRATIDETLRLRPVAGALFRRLARPLQLGAWRLEPGVCISPSIVLLHANPQYWPEPERFAPERFMASRPSPHVYMPFGAGTHRCLGAPLARFQLAVMLAVLLREFEFELTEPGDVPWVQQGIPLGPSTGIRMIRRATIDHGHAGMSGSSAASAPVSVLPVALVSDSLPASPASALRDDAHADVFEARGRVFPRADAFGALPIADRIGE